MYSSGDPVAARAVTWSSRRNRPEKSVFLLVSTCLLGLLGLVMYGNLIDYAHPNEDERR